MQRKLSFTGKNIAETIPRALKILDVDVTNCRSQQRGSFCRSLVRRQKAVHRVPNNSGIPRARFRQDRCGFTCGTEVAMGFKPNLNALPARSFREPMNGLCDPASSRFLTGAGLDRITEDADCGGPEFRRQV